MKRSRFFKFAVLPGLLAFVAFLCLAFYRIYMFILLPAVLIILIFGLTILYLAINTKSSKEKYFSIAGLILLTILAIATFDFGIGLKKIIEEILCRERLYGLRQYLVSYSEDNNNKYPQPDKWCDLLKEKGCPEIYFICPTQKNASCSYAINPNAEPNSPYDTVLVFESIDGANTFGAVSLIDANNHKYKGANILFNGGHVDFVEPNDFNDLKW